MLVPVPTTRARAAIRHNQNIIRQEHGSGPCAPFKKLGKTGMRYNHPGPVKCNSDTFNFLLTACNHACSARVRVHPPINRGPEQAWRQGENSRSTRRQPATEHRIDALRSIQRYGGSLVWCADAMCAVFCDAGSHRLFKLLCVLTAVLTLAGVSPARHPPQLCLGRSPAQGQ